MADFKSITKFFELYELAGYKKTCTVYVNAYVDVSDRLQAAKFSKRSIFLVDMSFGKISVSEIEIQTKLKRERQRD